MDINKIAEGVAGYLASQPDGTEISISEAINKICKGAFVNGGNYKIGDEIIPVESFFDIDIKACTLARERGVILDCSDNANETIGLPFNVRYKVINNQ